MIGPRLAHAGYEVVEAADGKEALERLSAGGISLALLDVMLPDIDGYEILAKIREGRIRPPVIFLSLILIDADKLKQTNDRLGHPAGDELLRALARAIRATCRETDRPARIGGDEFAILLPETTRSDAEAFLDRLRRAVEAEVVGFGEASFRPEFSAGLAVLPDDAKDKEMLHRRADEALYRDKLARSLDGLHYP